MREKGEYAAAFMKMFGGARPFITRKSCKSQFYSDLVTPLPDHIDTPTEIHVFYALKMGPKYRARYMRHFAHQFCMNRICSTRSCWPAIRRNGLSWSGGLWKEKKEKNDEICAF